MKLQRFANKPKHKNRTWIGTTPPLAATIERVTANNANLRKYEQDGLDTLEIPKRTESLSHSRQFALFAVNILCAVQFPCLLLLVVSSLRYFSPSRLRVRRRRQTTASRVPQASA
jgi:hypothetical protein